MNTQRKRHIPEQIVHKLGQADRLLGGGKTVANVCRASEVAEQTYYRWRNQYGGMKADAAQRLKKLEKQNAWLETIAGRGRARKGSVERACGGKFQGPGRRRAAFAHLLRFFAISERMACRLAGLSCSAWRRPLNHDTVADPDQPLRAWLCQYAKDHPRWGYHRAYRDARAEGWPVNHEKIQRLWRDEGLRVPQRRCKRVGSSTIAAAAADAPNVVWTVDVQIDVCERCQVLTICPVVDEHTRECIGGLVERSITADRFIEHLETLIV